MMRLAARVLIHEHSGSNPNCHGGMITFSWCTELLAQPVSDTAFTYQGSLQQSGQQVTEQCDFEFSLWTGSNS